MHQPWLRCSIATDAASCPVTQRNLRISLIRFANVASVSADATVAMADELVL
jgi:hypothetical protein